MVMSAINGWTTVDSIDTTPPPIPHASATSHCTAMDTYTTWKKNARLLYRQLHTSALLWPSPSVDWLPDTLDPNGRYPQHRILLGTESNLVNATESLLITGTSLPNFQHPSFHEVGNFDYSSELNEFRSSLPIEKQRHTNELIRPTGPAGTAGTVPPRERLNPQSTETSELQTQLHSIAAGTSADAAADLGGDMQQQAHVSNSIGLIQRIPHCGDITTIRHCPQNPDLIATASSNGKARVFDRTRKPLGLTNTETYEDTADIVFDFHSDDLWTVAWNHVKAYTLATGANDSTIAIWDLNRQFTSPESKNSTCTMTSPHKVFANVHQDGVNSVAWIPTHDSLLLSAGEDGNCRLWDTRGKCDSAVVELASCNVSVNSIDIDKAHPFSFAAGDSAGHIHFMDLRQTSSPLTTKKDTHSSSVTVVKYHPSKSILATASMDSTAVLWSPLSEPLFTHRGHILPVNDLAFAPLQERILVATASNDNSVHVWEPLLEWTLPFVI